MAVERIEVITGTGARRRFSLEEKLRLIEETCEPGKSVSLVARRHGVSRDLLFRWRRQWRDGALGPGGLVAVRVAQERPACRPEAAAAGVIEIVLSNGCAVRVAGAVESGALARVLEVVARRPFCGSRGDGR